MRDAIHSMVKFLLFVKKNKIDVPDMDDTFIARGKSRRKDQEVTNLHQFHVELFYSVIHM